jgi:hypothetical protein
MEFTWEAGRFRPATTDKRKRSGGKYQGVIKLDPDLTAVHTVSRSS